MKKPAANPLKRHPLVSFFILAYGIAWIPLLFRNFPGHELLLGLASFSPAVAAIILISVNEGAVGIKSLVSRLFLWRVPFKWYLIALLAPITMELLAILTLRILGELVTTLSLSDWLQIIPAQLPGLAVMLLFLVMNSAGEELGWRGYAMPALQARFGSVWASLILGLLWGLWHLPTFWIPGSSQYGLPIPGYVLASIGFTFIYTCIFNGSKGSVLLACLFHGASNFTLTYANTIFPGVFGNLYLSLPALMIVAIIVKILSGPGGFIGRETMADKGHG